MFQFSCKILDPIHGFIRLNALEEKVISTPFFQRLQFIRQMGPAFLVYPGATHSRFQHSLGVLELASQIFDRLAEEFVQQFFLRSEECKYYKAIVRIAALCHDLGHLPFSHSAERALFGKNGHEEMTWKILQSEAFSFLEQELGRGALLDIAKLAIGPKKFHQISSSTDFTLQEQLLSQMITGDSFGADRMDYLLRDAYFTGVDYGRFDYQQLIDSLVVLKDSQTIGVYAKGVHSVEALLTARYFMHSRVYKHPKICSYNNHVSRYMAETFSPLKIEEYLHFTDDAILDQMRKSSHYDAAVILKKEPSFHALFLTFEEKAIFKKKKEEIIKKLGRDVIFSKKHSSSSDTHFLVLGENRKLIASHQHSGLLSRIPTHAALSDCFVHPNRVEEFKNLLEAPIESSWKDHCNN